MVMVTAVPGHGLPRESAVLVGAGVVGPVAAMLVVLLVVRPRPAHAARGSFLCWAKCTPEVLPEDPQNPSDHTARAAHLIHLSQLAHRKWQSRMV
ncbi:hypothetical protein [Streptomyces chartreusis]|uniref:hypothetical protein n=1 Tax=Streptomyces chartreusis TaxID=1969 RepID=UPI003678B9E2